MNPSRRNFLKRGVTATAILGFPFLGAGCLRFGNSNPPDEPDVDVLPLAQERMKQEVKPGIIIVIPEDQAAATRLAGELTLLLDGGLKGVCCDVPSQPIGLPVAPAPSARWLFCQAVFVCLPLERVRQFYPEASRETAVVLLDLDGRPVQSLWSEANLFGADFVSKMSDLLYGCKRSRLAAWTKAQRDALPPASRERFYAAVRGLNGGGIAARASAVLNLRDLAPHCTLMMAEAWESHPGSEVRDRIGMLFEELYAGASPEEPGPRLPFGARWEQPAPVKADPCPACGLACAPDASRRFLRFVANKQR